MNNIKEIDLKISKLNIEKDISFHKHQIEGYKSSLNDYNIKSNYHEYLLKNIEINLLSIENLKIKLEEIVKKDEEIKRKINYFNFITTIVTLIFISLIIYSVFPSKNEVENKLERKTRCIGETCIRLNSDE